VNLTESLPVDCCTSTGKGGGPLVKVIECVTPPGLQVHLTMLPTWTAPLSGLKKLLPTVTAPDVSGPVATSVKLAGLGRPLTVALTRWIVPDPTESFVLAIPIAFVVLCAGFTAPELSPDVTAHITTTPGTGRPLKSDTVTLNGVGSGLLKYQFCPAPPLGTTSAGGPGGWVPPPLQPDAQSVPTSAPHSVTRWSVIR